MGWHTEIIRQAEAAATDIQDGPSEQFEKNNLFG